MVLNQNEMAIIAPQWSAVFSLFLGVTGLITGEFLSISLLTPIAHDLSISEGLAGQAVTVVGLFAVTTSILLSPLTKTIDRRLILLSLSALLIVSNALVAIAPNYIVLLIARALLGICVGGFWSMSSAVALRLVPAKNVPRALSIIYAGVAVATIISIPVASYIGQFIGWRNVFWLAALLGTIGFIWQFLSLPSMPVKTVSRFRDMGQLLKTTWVIAGLGGMIFSYGGYHVFFTYLRPYIEQYLFLNSAKLSLILLGFGIANCLGTFFAGKLLGQGFRITIIAIHAILAFIAISFYFSNGNLIENIVLIMMWGFMFGIIPVAWSTWIVHTLADRAEIAGGLMVAAIQLSISIGAATGGAVFDSGGAKSIFAIATLFLGGAITLILISFQLFYKTTGKHA
ncbi:MFS transporter [Bartonella sp. HY406]|uniref:MFS transporter n=1 Tax=Bartonella sp. HY406 TaxID=2979331 RepID=UPI0021C88570|nr:MFS transporter [Bartonella sp. HY406]UXN02470.1 MFS transporter [Bartonella sp. HY406]